MDHRELEQSLREAGAATPAAWDRLRGELAGEAERAGLVDVAFERHETPLGTLVVGATREGLVRVGLPSEEEDDVLSQLAERVSPRVLRASRASLT
ncbi:MAG: methylated-DNA-[protein]-cysteine S-methyltransferase, partial [Gaiellales bacterium]|nr:methylated-DNA-[protein]-cysteine S-methyltransferase [Gaiellales bacterium]